jgi:hypothetical protein
MLRLCRWLICSLLLPILAGGLACGGEDRLAAALTTGTLEVTTSTSGAEPDDDGYIVQMDAEPAQAIGANATLQTADVAPGTHSVQLGEIAPNCTVAAENPRTVTIVAGETATVDFAVTCEAATGSVQVTSSTSGPVADPDGYSLMLDGSDRGTLGSSSDVTLNGLIPGTHQIGLSGVAANCQVEGTNPQDVFVTVGASATVAFTITCVEPPASTGTLTVATSTSGRNLDPDGTSSRLTAAWPSPSRRTALPTWPIWPPGFTRYVCRV